MPTVVRAPRPPPRPVVVPAPRPSAPRPRHKQQACSACDPREDPALPRVSAPEGCTRGGAGGAPCGAARGRMRSWRSFPCSGGGCREGTALSSSISVGQRGPPAILAAASCSARLHRAFPAPPPRSALPPRCEPQRTRMLRHWSTSPDCDVITTAQVIPTLENRNLLRPPCCRLLAKNRF